MSLTFEVGKKFDDITCDGRPVKTVVWRTGNRFMVHRAPINSEDKMVSMSFEFYPTGVVLSMTVMESDQICIQRFKRL